MAVSDMVAKKWMDTIHPGLVIYNYSTTTSTTLPNFSLEFLLT